MVTYFSIICTNTLHVTNAYHDFFSPLCATRSFLSGSYRYYRENFKGADVVLKRFTISKDKISQSAMKRIHNELKIIGILNSGNGHPNVVKFIGKFYDKTAPRSSDPITFLKNI